ncbi:MAG: SoxY-related AACIE arm protein [Pseudolabrys sp.]|nr:SoxY-related AACIE arm protein [Pseudolabrys sp.]
MSITDDPRFTLSRRAVLGGGGALTVTALTLRPASATPETMRAAIRQIVGDAELKKGRVHLEIPPLVENGNTVSCSVSVDSPMTQADHVKAIHIVNEKNPQPNVISVALGPRAGRARFSTRIRLADTQKVIAIAQLSDGSFWSDSADVVITLGACLEE